MSRTPGRRKSSLKVISAFQEPVGPRIKFKWSISAAHLAVLEVNSPDILPTIDIDRYKRKYCAASISSIDQYSISQLSMDTYKSSSLPSITKQRQSPTSISTEKTESSPRSTPLSLSFAQLHQAPPSPPIKRSKQTRFTIFPAPNAKQDSMSFVNSTVSLTSRSPRSSRSSISSPASIPSLSSKANCRLPEDNLVRLRTPELRSLHVSEKYMKEAKKLFYNPNCKCFVPRVSMAQVF